MNTSPSHREDDIKEKLILKVDKYKKKCESLRKQRELEKKTYENKLKITSTELASREFELKMTQRKIKEQEA